VTDRTYGLATRAIHAGQRPDAGTGARVVPIYQNASFVFNDTDDAANLFALQKYGNVYSRIGNPTVAAFEECIASLEGGLGAVATASGLAAQFAVFAALTGAGDHIVAAASLYGGTVTQLDVSLRRFGVDTTFVPAADVAAWEQAMRPNTRLLFLETPSNPLTEVSDVTALADVAHRHGALLVVDNCFCSPALQRPLELGADIVMHSATKFLDGQGRVLGGAVLGRRELILDGMTTFLRSCGPTLSPFNAWVILKGLETLGLRMQAHSKGALELAQWLEQHPKVERVYYPGLASHPQHALAMRQQKSGGGIVSFDVKGGREEAWKVVDSTQLISITANLGDTKTTITHPASTTHGRIAQEARKAAGIGEGLLRIAVGLEAVSDVKADLARGLSKV